MGEKAEDTDTRKCSGKATHFGNINAPKVYRSQRQRLSELPAWSKSNNDQSRALE